MKTAGITAEYNPFHNGHAYHIEETRRLTGADYIIVVMSGDFVQRGEPALIDKYSRARMALQNGADLVLELPAAYACASAETFAAGAVHTLHQLGVTDFISFGCESDNLSLISRLARLYLDEPCEFSERIQGLLRQGLTYPQARAAATEELLSFRSEEELRSLLASPNNILAIEYQKALLRFGSDIKPLAIPRLGSYHSKLLPPTQSSCQQNPSGYASASALRSLLLWNDFSAAPDTELLQQLSSHVPSDVAEELLGRRDYLCAEDFSSALSYALLTSCHDDLTRYADITPDLADRIRKQTEEFSGWESFTDRIKTRQMTRSRISRALLHLLLQIRTEQMTLLSRDGLACYARVLGFQKKSQPLLTAIKQNSRIPMITKVADARETLQAFYRTDSKRLEEALSLFHTDLFAAGLYETTKALRYGRAKNNEYRHGMIIV